MTTSHSNCDDSSKLSDASDVWAKFLQIHAARWAPEQPLLNDLAGRSRVLRRLGRSTLTVAQRPRIGHIGARFTCPVHPNELTLPYINPRRVPRAAG